MITLNGEYQYDSIVTALLFELNTVSKNMVPGEDGWIWWSLNLRTQTQNATIADVLSSVLAETTMIKSQSGFLRKIGTTWEGFWESTKVSGSDLTDVVMESGSDIITKMYQLYMTSSATYVYNGLPILDPVSITLSKGFNWVGYHYDTIKDIATSDYHGNQYITLVKDEFSDATIVGGVSNVLMDLEPGVGYKVLCSQTVTLTTGATETLIYETSLGDAEISTIDSTSIETTVTEESLVFKQNNEILLTIEPPEDTTGLSQISLTADSIEVKLSSEWSIITSTSENNLQFTYNNFLQMEIEPSSVGEQATGSVTNEIINDIGNQQLGDNWAMNSDNGFELFWRNTISDDYIRQVALLVN